MQGTRELDERFSAHKLTHEQSAAQDQIRRMAKHAARFVDANVADNREKSIALTKLEEFVMWANKAISKEP